MPHGLQGIRIPDWEEIKSYFTDVDVQHMLAHTGGKLNLHDCASVLASADEIYSQVSSGRMPPGNPWGSDRINGFYSWWKSSPTCPSANPLAGVSAPQRAATTPTEVTNPITRHQITILGTGGKVDALWGWIQLVNGAVDAGYIYFYDTPGVAMPADRLGSKGYIVMNLPVALFGQVLDVLRNEAPVSIRFYQNSSSDPAYTFLETH